MPESNLFDGPTGFPEELWNKVMTKCNESPLCVLGEQQWEASFECWRTRNPRCLPQNEWDSFWALWFTSKPNDQNDTFWMFKLNEWIRKISADQMQSQPEDMPEEMWSIIGPYIGTEISSMHESCLDSSDNSIDVLLDVAIKYRSDLDRDKLRLFVEAWQKKCAEELRISEPKLFLIQWLSHLPVEMPIEMKNNVLELWTIQESNRIKYEEWVATLSIWQGQRPEYLSDENYNKLWLWWFKRVDDYTTNDEWMTDFSNGLSR